MIINRIVLGVSDPEMSAIASLAAECGVPTVQATVGGRPVTPATAYRADAPSPVEGDLWVECLPGPGRYGCAHDPEDEGCEVAGAARLRHVGAMRADHHEPGDPGYGRPPAEFLAASSIGQVIAALARAGQLPEGWVYARPEAHGPGRLPLEPGRIRYVREHGPRRLTSGPWPEERIRDRGPAWVTEGTVDGGHSALLYEIPTDYCLVAAADHCLAAAYAGQCPGVDPDELMRWRAETRAAFQGRPVADVIRDVEETAAALRAAPVVELAPESHEWCDPGLCGCRGANPTGDCYDEEHLPAVTVADMRHDRCRGCEVCGQQGDECSLLGCAHASNSACCRATPWPELPEAGARVGIGYISGPLTGPDGRSKYTCSGTVGQVEAFMAAARSGRVAGAKVDPASVYGDPARGFAGAYLEAP